MEPTQQELTNMYLRHLRTGYYRASSLREALQDEAPGTVNHAAITAALAAYERESQVA